MVLQQVINTICVYEYLQYVTCSILFMSTYYTQYKKKLNFTNSLFQLTILLYENVISLGYNVYSTIRSLDETVVISFLSGFP